MIRVITGKAKGKKLQVAENISRALTDRIKTSLFDKISLIIPNANVLDCYAGSGSFGIECISRGANHVIFIEISDDAINTIQTNLSNCNFLDQSTIIQSYVDEYLASSSDIFDIIFLDPPFPLSANDKVQSLNISSKLITNNGYIIMRYPKSEHTFIINNISSNIEVVYTKHFGLSTIIICNKVTNF
jgi:16S rRNA (guanine966-N2)-methyltransferase